MCQFCHKHGEGKKWYLQAKNYSDDLLADVRRRRLLEGFVSQAGGFTREAMAKMEDGLTKFDRSPALVRGIMRRMISRRMKRDHFGQVVPMEEIERIFGLVNSIVRLACVCRHGLLGQEKRYCYGVSLMPDGGEFGRIMAGACKSFASGPDVSRLEKLSREQAVESFRAHEKEGLCHTVWTFGTPFIGGICNCDRTDCMAMRCTMGHGLPMMFRAEWVARVDHDKCTGCRQCMRVCQFGAMGYGASNKKCAVSPRHCYGCGVCRSACASGAIALDERRKTPVAKLWE